MVLLTSLGVAACGGGNSGIFSDGDGGGAAGKGSTQTLEVYFDEYGDEVGYRKGFVDANGNLTKVVRYIGRGDDGTWSHDAELQASDDLVSEVTEYEYDSDGRLSRTTRYSDSGTGGVWYDGNDVVSSYDEYAYGGDGNIVRAENFDGDGVRTGYTAYTYAYDSVSKTYKKDVTTYSDNGGDVWFDDNDVISSYAKYLYDDNDNLLREASFSGSGGDGEWMTGDDVISSYKGYLYDQEGRLERISEYSGSGSDETWFTSKDTVSGYTVYEYDTTSTQEDIRISATSFDGPVEIVLPRNLIQVTKYNPDDTVVDYYSYVLENGKWRRVEYLGAGSDGDWHTGDDDVAAYSEYELDSAGNISRKVEYAAGPDNAWLSPDDEVSAYTQYSYSSSGQLAGWARYNDAGNDGRWFYVPDAQLGSAVGTAMAAEYTPN